MEPVRLIIRPLTDQDIPAIIHLGGRMHDESQYRVLTYAPEKVAVKCYQVMADSFSLGIVAEQDGEIVGMMGGYISPYDYGDELIATDILVFVAPEHRGSMAFIKLVRAYVKWAKERGAKLILLVQTTGINPELVSDIYNRLGFKPVGGMHCLEV